MTFGLKLKLLMVVNEDMSQGQAAKALSVSQSTISRWLKDDREPTLKEANRVASYFAVPLDWLANDAEEFPPPGPSIRFVGGPKPMPLPPASMPPKGDDEPTKPKQRPRRVK